MAPPTRCSRNTSAVIRGTILPHFKRLAFALGADPIALLARAGIDRSHLENPELFLPMRSIGELLEIAALTSGTEDFGLRLAEVRGLPDLGPVTLMLREEETVRHALRTMIALLHLHSDALYLHLEESDEPILTVNILSPNAANFRQAIDTCVASNTSILRWLLGEDWVPASISFTHSRPTAMARFERFFRCPIDFHREFNGIVLHRRDLDKRLPASSPVLRRQVERYLHMLEINPRQTYLRRVTQLVAMALPIGEANADFIARCVGTDSRTLHRRLARAGMNYSSVVASVRKNVAVQHLLGSDRPLSDISGMIGFDSLSAFSRWFRQSFNATPSAWRKAQRQSL